MTGEQPVGCQQPAGIMLEEIEDARPHDPTQRREPGEGVHRLQVQVALTQPARRREGDDEDAQRDREAVPRQRQRPELNLAGRC